jgi:prolipoprotein diacylglyceryltransferase
MDIYEKAGDLVIDIAKLVIGGILLAAIMLDYNSNSSTRLLAMGSIISVTLIIIGFVLYKFQARKTKKKKQRKN